VSKYLETLLAAALFGAALFALLFGKPYAFAYDSAHFIVLEVHLWAMMLVLGGLWFAIGIWSAHPELRGLLIAAALVAMLPAVVRIANEPFIVGW
jgi:hypothetical protein